MRLTHDIKGIFRSRAYFIAGKPAADRISDDARVEDAIERAQIFFCALPESLPPPSITAGTTVSPENVITLVWYSPGRSRIRSLAVSFNYGGTHSIAWNQPDGEEVKIQDLTAEQLGAQYVPGKVAALMGQAAPPASRRLGP